MPTGHSVRSEQSPIAPQRSKDHNNQRRKKNCHRPFGQRPQSGEKIEAKQPPRSWLEYQPYQHSMAAVNIAVSGMSVEALRPKPMTIAEAAVISAASSCMPRRKWRAQT